MRNLRSIFAMLAMVTIYAMPAYSQAVNATLVGTVTDASGGVVANAKITATETNTGVSRVGNTNESGNYSFPNLPPGTYSVTPEQAGFKKSTRTNVDVLVDTTTRVDMVLQPGAVTETIEVTAMASILQTDRADIGRKIETEQLRTCRSDITATFRRCSTRCLGPAAPSSRIRSSSTRRVR